jgi:DNA-binding transcriptional ArsR family regulator
MRNQLVTHSAEAAFQALGDPTRRALLDLLRQSSQPTGKIAESFPVSRPAISKHLRILLRANLVLERKQGRHRFYEINPEPLKIVDQWLEPYRAFWNSKLADLKSFVEADQREALPKKKKRTP